MADFAALAQALETLAGGAQPPSSARPSSAAQRPPASAAQQTRPARPNLWADLEGTMHAAGIRERSRSPARDLVSLAEPPHEEATPPSTPLDPSREMPEEEKEDEGTSPAEQTLEEIAELDEKRYYEEHCVAEEVAEEAAAEEVVGEKVEAVEWSQELEDTTSAEVDMAEKEGYMLPTAKARPTSSASAAAWFPKPPPPPAPLVPQQPMGPPPGWVPEPPPRPVRPRGPRPEPSWPGAYWRQYAQRYGSRGGQQSPNVQWHTQRAKAKREGWLEACRITGRMITRPGKFSPSPKS